MKIAATLSFLVLLPTIGAQCDFCPNGMTAGNDTVVPDANDLRCGDLLQISLRPNVDAQTCTSLQKAHFWCCPADLDDGCEFCPTGVENVNTIVADGGTTCSDYGVSKSFAPEDMCADYTAAEELCCPKGEGVTCSFCDNMTYPEAVFGNRNCRSIGLYLNGLSAGTAECLSLSAARSVCCPSEVGPGCTFCKDGVTAPDFDFDDGSTCTDLVDNAKIAPQELCTQFEHAEAVCCSPPTPGGSPTGSPTAAPRDDDSGSGLVYSMTLCMMMTMLIVSVVYCY